MIAQHATASCNSQESLIMRLHNILHFLRICFIWIICSHAFAQHPMEVVATFDAKTPPGNIAIGPDGRIFLSVHPFYGQPVRVVELLKNGKTTPYPNATFGMAAQTQKHGGLYGVLGLNVDKNGILWMLDSSGENHSGRLIGWNTRTEQLERIIYLAKPFIDNNSFLNDLAIDTTHNAIYIADTGTTSILVVDLNTGAVRQTLQTAPQTKPEDKDMVIDGRVVTLDGKPSRIGINPITIDANDEYVYFGAMTGSTLYRIKTADLLNTNLTEATLIKRIQTYAEKPISDGITIDTAGNVYITSITQDAIGVSKPDGSYEKLFGRDDLSWPDGFAVGPDNFIYATINELHRSPVLNNDVNATQGEFKVIRFKALAPAEVGR